jgi:DGQHR domain-containing protein
METKLVQELERGEADFGNEARLRYSVSLVKQGKHQFYTLTMPSEVLWETCKVSTRKEDPKIGFQRELDVKRAMDIARYIDEDMGTIPSSIVLSAQAVAELKIVGRGKTLEFSKTKGAFLILDGQHRVYGFSKAKTSLRVPVVIYNGLSRREETRLFIDINTKQKPVPSQLLLDIKQLAEIESESEAILRDIFDLFDQSANSAMGGLMSASDSARSKISRVTFNQAIKPHLSLFSSRPPEEIYMILNSYLTAISAEIAKKTASPILSRPVVFRAFLGIFRLVALRVSDRYGSDFTPANFQEFVAPMFANMPKSKLETPGSSWTALRDYFEGRLVSKVLL